MNDPNSRERNRLRSRKSQRCGDGSAYGAQVLYTGTNTSHNQVRRKCVLFGTIHIIRCDGNECAFWKHTNQS